MEANIEGTHEFVNAQRYASLHDAEFPDPLPDIRL